MGREGQGEPETRVHALAELPACTAPWHGECTLHDMLHDLHVQGWSLCYNH